jgi:hypothetical protein
VKGFDNSVHKSRTSGLGGSRNYLRFPRITVGNPFALYLGEMLKIIRSDDKGSTVLTLYGRIEESDLPELQSVLDAEARSADVTIDLQEVRHVYRDAVGFFATCRANRITLKNCPPYIHEWLEAESHRNSRRKLLRIMESRHRQ